MWNLAYPCNWFSAALPADVRWRLCPTVTQPEPLWGCTPIPGVARKNQRVLAGRSETFRTSEGKAHKTNRICHSGELN